MMQIVNVPLPGVVYAPENFARWATLDLERAERHSDNVKSLTASGEPPFSDEVVRQLEAEVDELSKNISSVILFAALEVEATLNFHGVVLLGNDYFDRNMERLRPEEKLAGLVAIARQSLVEKDDEINVVLRRIFTGRNGVAHPKTKAFKDWDSVKATIDETIETARLAVADMSRFLELFRLLVPVGGGVPAMMRGEEVDTGDSPTSR